MSRLGELQNAKIMNTFYFFHFTPSKKHLPPKKEYKLKKIQLFLTTDNLKSVSYELCVWQNCKYCVSEEFDYKILHYPFNLIDFSNTITPCNDN